MKFPQSCPFPYDQPLRCEILVHDTEPKNVSYKIYVGNKGPSLFKVPERAFGKDADEMEGYFFSLRKKGLSL